MRRQYFFWTIFFGLTVSTILTAFANLGQLDHSIPKLRTDGYYYTYDTLVNTQTNDKIIRFYPIVFFDDQTLADFYWQRSQLDFEILLKRKKYKGIKKFSKFGDYKIVGDSIYIHQRTWSNKFFGNDKGKIVDAYMKCVILNDTTFQMTENIFLGDTMRPPHYYFKFNAYTFKK